MKKALFYIFLLIVIVYAIPNIFYGMIIIWHRIHALLGIGFFVVAVFVLIKLVQTVRKWAYKK